MDTAQPNDLTRLTIELLSAFVANNNVRSEDLPTLIASTHAALSSLAAPSQDTNPEPVAETHEPAVTPRKSLANREFIVSLIDGKPYKSLKRHLTARGLTPNEYRERYGLPASYPMVAPAYSEARRETAKRLGLGRKPRAPEAPVQAPAQKAARKPRAAKPAAAE